MKFTAKSTDIGHIESFVRTVNTVTKLSKNLILRITEDHIYFTKHESLKDGCFKLWCDILAFDQLFLLKVSCIDETELHFSALNRVILMQLYEIFPCQKQTYIPLCLPTYSYVESSSGYPWEPAYLSEKVLLNFLLTFIQPAKAARSQEIETVLVMLYKHVFSHMTKKYENLHVIAFFQNRFFEDFRMEGLSSEQNEIYLELDSEAFGRAVRSANNAKYLRMKLTKKNVPYLALEMKFPSTTSRVVTHDVPVRVVAPRLWKEYAEPDVPKFHSSLYLPPVKIIHKVATSMKNMIVKHVVISANNDGEMNFKIESDVATVTTHFGDLVRPDWKDEEHNRLVASQVEPEDENFDKSNFYSVRIEVKTLLQFLNNQQIVFCRLMANIVNMKYLHLYVSNDDFRLQYFIPAVLY